TLVDNIIVYKNFSPDLPGDFTGGLVDIRTKTHPTEFQLSFSASVSYNPTAHLRDDFLTYEGGNTDWLGIDDGTRDIPAFVLNGEQNGFPLVYPDDPSQNRTVFNLLGRTGLDSVEAVTAQRQQQSFGDFYTIRQKRSGLNQNYQFSVGNQTNLFGKPFGFLVGLSYRRAFQYNEDYRLARFETVLGEVEPRRERDVMGVVTEEEALWGGILGLSYKLSPRNKFSFTYMRNQSGINTTRQQSGTEEVNLPTTDLRVDETQSFQERSLDLFQLRAEHVLGKVKLDWQGSYTFSTDDQPDFRIVQYLERGTPELRPRLDENGQPIFDQDGNFIIDTLPMTFDYQSSINDFPTRYYRNLDEDNIDLRLNLDVPWRVREEREAIIGLGGAYTFKDRSFSEERYAMELGNIKAPPIDFLSNGDIDLALAPANANYVQNEFSGTFNALLAYDKRSQGTNAYRADQSVLGAYAMIEYPITASLRTVAGVRLEVTEINIATDSLGNITQGGRRQPPIRGGLSEQDLLPAVNLIYGISEKMNLRGGYSRTLARPSFRELAPYRSFAFFGDFVLFGNEDIERTLIDNFDLRWEWFPSPGQLFSIGGFYKDLDQPIVRAFTTPGGGEVSYLNVPRAEAFGFEVEVRKNLGFVADWLNVIQVNGNFTLLQSRSDLDSTSAASARIRGTEDTRPLFGQPSYTFNAELAYLDPERPGFQASLSYSIFGERMTVGGTFNYNVFEQPRGVLNATLRKTLGERWAVRVRARNLLDPEFREFYRDESIPGGREDLFESFRRGRRISVGLSYRI
ncbi:MAG: TonB-dependent receptor, partial [Bacteroidota bacterium]